MIRKLLVLLLFPIAVFGQRSIPEHEGIWVHDEANVLSPQVRANVESILKHERDSTSNQIAVYIIRSLDGEVPEDYSLRVAEKWKLGKKDIDNGVLWLVSIDDRKMRIEVGHGLEGSLTDLTASRIDRNDVAPYFQRGDYDGGVTVGVLSIIRAIEGQYVNTDPPKQRMTKKGRSPLGLLVIVIVIILAAKGRRGGGGGGLWILASLLGSGMGRGGGSYGGGGRDFDGGGSFGGGGSSDSW